MKYIIFYLIQFTWGIIQNAFGLIMLIKYRNCKKEFYHGSIIIYHNEDWGGISLGAFIIMNGNKNEEWIRSVRVHEYGHSIQSIILGPLYLLAIGIPSILWCNMTRYRKLRKEQGVSYYSFYPERWANYLGAKFTKELPPTV